ncbi:carboxypeptidase S [Metschnikowia bicuspidata var. bicuspidata NRRL YB-4993]|uniref:Carboxypeptidase S n=1 Tax=Metschnikowia bicuspidata var. bicuspidata NRRL YB-4993 TaxID=869754 RepID=A0A1A0H943_9ASCO|nr:carboxypeptidase S [Metschnikowia bicuspidata var. bicuspidata NRRL YB-4993]OBA20520.1 carboxypeptidase S [Metschnikowia bicuspidata var. bicuspidata NRRL YB-4993]
MIGLPLDDGPVNKKQYGAIGATAALLLIVLFGTNLFSILKIYMVPVSDKDICTIWDIQRPASYESNRSSVIDILHSKDYRLSSAEALSGMVQIDTQVFDDPPLVDEAPEYWLKFENFHKYLAKTFPAVYKNLEVTRVNTYGLVFVWKGADDSLKPVMLAGHQDVVPVQKDTLRDWTYPPFSGHYDGEFVYGRGAADCKNVVLAIFESLELLCKENFRPARSIVVALGFDEEVSGYNGARFIGQYLVERFGEDSFYAIIDEGFGLTVDETTGRIVAMPGTREKGYMDIWAELITPGGHSSIPPDHTSIGIMGELQMVIEKDQFAPVFSPENPTFDYMQCLAKHAGGSMSTKLRKSILRAGFDKLANSYVVEVLTNIKATKFLILTSQSMDIISGGEKVNALPESVKLLTNHRIAIESNVEDVMNHFIKRVVEVAKRHGLGVKSGDTTIIESSGNGEFNVRDSGKNLEVAPRTPNNDNVWKSLAGVTRHIYEDLVFPDMAEPLIVAPAIMTGNTDTRHYWTLTKNIFRYTPFFSRSYTEEYKVHSVDEKMSLDNHLRIVAFFYEYLQVVDNKETENE